LNLIVLHREGKPFNMPITDVRNARILDKVKLEQNILSSNSILELSNNSLFTTLFCLLATREHIPKNKIDLYRNYEDYQASQKDLTISITPVCIYSPTYGKSFWIN
jgi:hypothetical protein